MKVTIEEQKLYDDFTVSVFQRGYEKGKEDATISYQNAYNEGHVDGYAKGVDDRDSDIKSGYMNGYNKGLNDAWECAKNIINSYNCNCSDSIPKYADIFGEYLTVHLFDISASEAIAKIKEYEEKKNEIHVGDEVVSDAFDEKGIVTHINDKSCVSLICDMNSMINTSLDKVHKTGKSYPQIVEILEQLKGDKE